nr:MAG TPA: hypothetical protein [Caudoviricetes sp.]
MSGSAHYLTGISVRSVVGSSRCFSDAGRGY